MKYVPDEEELRSYAKSMVEIFHKINSLNPGAVVFPLRGAFPFYHCYSVLADAYNVAMPDVLLVPLGDQLDDAGKTESGITKPEKIARINSYIDLWKKNSDRNGSLLLVDEVVNGGTIIGHYKMLNYYLTHNHPDTELMAIAVEDGSKQQRGKYRNFAEKNDFKIVRPASLFTVDRPQFLPLVHSDGFIDSSRADEGLDFIVDAMAKVI